MKRDLLEHILHASCRMAGTRMLEPLLNYVVDEAIELTGAERGYIVLARPDGSLDFLVTRDQGGRELTGAEDQISRSILRQVVDDSEPLVLRDAALDPNFGSADSVVMLGLRSVMCVPLITQGKTIGAIYVENRSIRGRFCDDDAIPLVLLANQAAVAIENTQLFEKLRGAHHDLEARVQERTAELSQAISMLKQERDRAQRYLDIAGVIILALDAQGNITLINRQGCDVLECSREEAINRNWFDTFLPERVLDDTKAVFAGLMGGEMPPFEYVESPMLTASGRERIVRWHNSLLIDPAGNRIGTLSSGEDITERREAQEKIRQRNRELAEFNTIIGALTSTLALEEVLQQIVTAAPRFFSYTVDATIQLLDESGALFTWVASDKIDTSKMSTVFPPGQGIAGIALREGRPVNVPDVTTEPNFYLGPSPLVFRSLLVVPLISRGQPLGTLSITAPQVGAFDDRDQELILGLGRYAAIAVQNARWYEQTRRDAEAKTILLREVNHRVKNNLTGIIGLLQTERRYAAPEGRPVVQAAMDRIIQRINGLAQVHDMLSQSGWSPVSVNELATRITSTALNALPLDHQVLIDVTPSPVKISPAQANNLALVLNELVTNTFKHAKSEEETTSITIQIEEDNGTIVIEYRDNGPGYPPAIIDQDFDSVGLYLVHNLVCHTLHGSLSLTNDGGAVTTICFEAEERSTT